MHKKRILSLFLAVMFVASIAAPVLAVEAEGATTYAQIKAMFPQADILENMGNPYERVVVRRDAKSVVTDFKYDVAKEDAKPVDVYELEGYGGFHTLNVYADGSFELYSITNETNQTRAGGVSSFAIDRSDSTYNYYDGVLVKYTSGSSYAQYRTDAKYRINDGYWFFSGNPYSASSHGDYGSGSGGDYTNGSIQSSTYKNFTFYYTDWGGTDINGNDIWIPCSSPVALRLILYSGKTSSSSANVRMV